MPTKAIVRTPPPNLGEGLTSVVLGAPDYEEALKQHAAYCEALASCGLEVICLEPDPLFPDSHFVEDTAVFLDKCAVITRPGVQERRGEVHTVREALRPHINLESVGPPAKIDGGDVLRINRHYYIGRTERTNAAGAGQLGYIFARFGYTVSTLPVKDMLHLKSGVTGLPGGRVLATQTFAELKAFQRHNPIVVDEDEAYAANCLEVNGKVIISAGFPKTKAKLETAGYKILEVETSEFQKMDGALTCLSLIF